MARKDADKGARARKAENMAAALEYKKAGANERFIAARLGISQATVNRYINEALAELKERGLQSVEEMRMLEAARIDQGRFAIAAKVVRGELDALDRWFKASESYRKLYGLDKPSKLALTDANGEAMWMPFDPKLLAENLTPAQLELLEEVLGILERAGGKDKSKDSSDAGDDE
jgi:predicted transcriptional regulator